MLLVEDEPAVRVLVRIPYPGLFGYQVLEARHGFEEQLIANQHTGPIHLLITDVAVPQMSGQELAEALASEHADMKVLLHVRIYRKCRPSPRCTEPWDRLSSETVHA